MATARLRKTFHYPAEGDDDSDEPAEGIDEEGSVSAPTAPASHNR